MSTRTKSRPNSSSALSLIARKQRLGKVDAEKIELLYLIHFDTIRRNQCGVVGRDHVAFSIVAAMFLSRVTKNTAMDYLAAKAYVALQNASARNPDLLTLTTGEYKEICNFHSVYFSLLRFIEIGIIQECAACAADILQVKIREAA